MMLQYRQCTGENTLAGELLGTGYSGNGVGLNNPLFEAWHNKGPIPAGRWQIGTWFDHPHLGPCVAPLTPIGHDAHGRTGFFIHGDSSAANHTASDGCIVDGPSIRHAIRDSGETELEVV